MRLFVQRSPKRAVLACAAATVAEPSAALGRVLRARPREPGAPQSAVYTARGVRYQAVTGKLDELFPKPGAGSSVAGEAPALAIDVVRPEGDTVRLLVPGTDGDELELEPALIYEEATSTLFVLWLARGTNERSHVLFGALHGEPLRRPGLGHA